MECWKSWRNRALLQSSYSALYAFVGVGSHALQNLYPVLQYLGIRIKYICCKSADKLPMIEQRFGVIATTSLEMILNDNDIKGVFVCTSPQSHYEICSEVIKAGKYLFVEKPPCLTLDQLEKLIDADKHNRTMVGMQKRYSPLIVELKKRLSLKGDKSYTLSYHSGAYPEGDAIIDLFIHPVDLVLYLFGDAGIKAVQRVDYKNVVTIQLLLSHAHAKGFIELSTAYSWNNGEENLRVNTLSGEYQLGQMERLIYYPHPPKIMGIPLEKLGLFKATDRRLSERNSFSPVMCNNQLYTQGFLGEVKAFVDMVEQSGRNLSALSSIRSTYKLLSLLKQDLL